jgi:hypothetical protein
VISKAIFNRLSTDAGVSGIVGTRVYPEDVREWEKRFPLVVYKIEGVTALRAHDGPIGLSQATILVAANATTYDGAATLGGAIQACLDTVKGTWAGVVVQGCFLADDGVFDDVVVLTESVKLTVYVRQLTFRITWEE